MAIRNALNVIGREFFQASLVTYLVLTLTETLKEGFVSNFFNMNYLLAAVLVSGIMMVLTDQEQSRSASNELSQSIIRLAILSAYQARKARLAAQQRTLKFNSTAATAPPAKAHTKHIDYRIGKTTGKLKAVVPAPPVIAKRKHRNIDGIL